MPGRDIPETSLHPTPDPAALVAAATPVVIRGLVAHWPAVAAAQAGAAAFAAYCGTFDRGAKASCVVGPPAIGGRFFYRGDFRGFNFERRDAAVGDVLVQLGKQAGRAEPLAIAMQSAALDTVLPGFAEANAMAMLPGVRPRLWLGNAVRVATHYDSNDNIACVVAGRRRFTLFPPDQIANLYPGPLEITPAGTPVSMVDVDKPDLDRFPRFAAAQEAAWHAELAPGDAIFIPYLWWHAVRSLDPLSVLVNYWWSEAGSDTAQLDAMLHAMLSMRDLPPARRAAWHALFAHLVFAADADPAAHLPEHVRGVLGTLSPERQQELRRHLADGIARRP